MRSVTRIMLLACVAAIAAIVPATGANAAISTSTIDYGSFTIPAGGGDPHDHMSMGHISNQIDWDVAKPCSGCTIIKIEPSLVYSDGSTANIADGPMLHHTLLAAKGGGKSDATCAGTSVGFLGERFFAAGNERTVMDVSSVDYGYKIGSNEDFNMVTELANWETTSKTVYVRMKYTYATGSHHNNRDALTPVWLDLDQCGDSEVSVPSGLSDSHYDWTVDVPGDIIHTAGHIHDHGVNVELTNESDNGSLICDSVAGYGGTGYVTPDGRSHVSSMSTCLGDPLATISNNQTLRLHAIYDVPSGHHAIDNAMGIMIAYIAE
ncbi:MAG: hypothetical protein WD993_10015 [Thermoleophilaceae bacterium]